MSGLIPVAWPSPGATGEFDWLLVNYDNIKVLLTGAISLAKIRDYLSRPPIFCARYSDVVIFYK